MKNKITINSKVFIQTAEAVSKFNSLCKLEKSLTATSEKMHYEKFLISNYLQDLCGIDFIMKNLYIATKDNILRKLNKMLVTIEGFIVVLSVIASKYFSIEIRLKEDG